MTKIQDIPAEERWPSLYKYIRKSFPIALLLFGGFGIAWIILGLAFQGIGLRVSKTTVDNGIQTVTTTTTSNLLANQIMQIIMWPALIGGFWLYMALLLRIPSRLNMLGGEEVESEE